MNYLLRTPISLAEFKQSFSETWKFDGPARFGLALSGGVDSMALAYLWSFLLKSPSRDLRGSSKHPVSYFQSFVVNHGARQGSAEEAQLVATRLEKLLGKRPITLNLGSDIFPAEDQSSGLETKLRSLRYRALAQASREHRIEGIFLAHHANDRAETTLLRLANNSRGVFLNAFHPNSQIPECFGMYGIYESGASKANQSEGHRLEGPESGGLRVLRPLLEFPKSRLQATCIEAGVEWVEDESNRDVTLTPRNAVRSFLGTNSLPAALSVPSILQFAERLRILEERQDGLAELLYQACKVLSFDIRTGVLKIWIPHPSTVFGTDSEYWKSDVNNTVLAIFLRKLAQSVSPMEVVKLKAVTSRIQSTFSFNPRSWAAGRVLFQPQPSLEGAASDGGTLFWIHRAPPENSEVREAGVAVDGPMSSPLSRSFVLWDGRFWMQIRNRSATRLIVEHLTRSKLEKLYLKLNVRSRRVLNDKLRKYAFGRIRWTLPAISTVDELDAVPKEEVLASQPVAMKKNCGNVVALPTLGWALENWKHDLSWDIRYKKTGLDGLQEREKFVLSSEAIPVNSA